MAMVHSAFATAMMPAAGGADDMMLPGGSACRLPSLPSLPLASADLNSLFSADDALPESLAARNQHFGPPIGGLPELKLAQPQPFVCTSSGGASPPTPTPGLEPLPGGAASARAYHTPSSSTSDHSAGPAAAARQRRAAAVRAAAAVAAEEVEDDEEPFADPAARGARAKKGGKPGEPKKVGRPIAYKGDPNNPRLTEEERRRIKRRIANRESARRVRQKRTEMLDEMAGKHAVMAAQQQRLLAHLADLEGQKALMAGQLQELHNKWTQASASNARLVREVVALRRWLAAHGAQDPAAAAAAVAGAGRSPLLSSGFARGNAPVAATSTGMSVALPATAVVSGPAQRSESRMLAEAWLEPPLLGDLLAAE